MMHLAGKKILFLGDSITHGAGVSSRDNIFCRIVERETGAVCLEYGVSGSRIAHQPDGVENPKRLPFGVRVPDMDPQADIIVVMGGTNDYIHGAAPLGAMSDRTNDTFYGALHLLILQLIERYPDAQLVFMTPVHRLNDQTVGLNQFGQRRCTNLEGYVNIIQEVAAYYGIPVLDLFRTSGIQPDVPQLLERYMHDPTHPNDAGHRRIADRLMGFLSIL